MPSYRHASSWIVATGTFLALLYGLQLSEAVSGAATLIVGVGSCLVLGVSLRTNPSARQGPWGCLTAACVAFLIGIVLRPWATGQSGLASLSGDLFTVSGYACLVAALVLLIGPRGLVSHALTDGAIVCVGAGLLALEILALPAARIGNRPEFISVVAGLYPLWDVLTLLLVINLAFSTISHLPAFRLLAGAMVAMFVGDVGYAWIGAKGQLTGSPMLDLPFLFGFTLLAASAAHPSRARMTDVVAPPVQAWSFPRLALIMPALAAPAVLLVLGHPYGHLAPALTSAVLMALLLFRAISAVRSNVAIQQGLRHQATHDALTGLPNRILLVQRITQLLRGRRAGGAGPWVLFIDLDGFKLVNDHWGHDTGDGLLLEVSHRLLALGPEYTVARMSGDEFVIAGTGSQDEAVRLAERIQRDLSRPIELPGIEPVVACSIGIACLTDQLTAEALLRDADLAMYRAKAEGRGRWAAFDATMRQTVRDRVEIELALRQALARGQLWVAYQPIVDCRTGHMALD